jgi:hypothetical protein
MAEQGGSKTALPTISTWPADRFGPAGRVVGNRPEVTAAVNVRVGAHTKWVEVPR